VSILKEMRPFYSTWSDESWQDLNEYLIWLAEIASPPVFVKGEVIAEGQPETLLQDGEVPISPPKSGNS
jgi:hypothetical protein